MQSAIKKIKLVKMREMVLIVATLFEPFYLPNIYNLCYVLGLLLLLGRKSITNLESVLKSRDITLPTKVRIVKAIVFPVVMYGSPQEN